MRDVLSIIFAEVQIQDLNPQSMQYWGCSGSCSFVRSFALSSAVEQKKICLHRAMTIPPSPARYWYRYWCSRATRSRIRS